jgi:DNA gyrase subunit A
MGRTARGVTGIKFKLEGDSLVSMLAVKAVEEETEVIESSEEDIIEKDTTEDVSDVETADETENIDDEPAGACSLPQVLVISDAGMGKRSFVSKYRMTRRAAKGVVSIRLNKGEKVISAIQVEKNDEIIITTKNGQTVRIPTDEIRTIGRASKGVRIMNLKGKNDYIASVAKIMEVQFEKEIEQLEKEEETSEPKKNEETIDAAEIKPESAEVATGIEPEEDKPEK